MVVTLAVLLRVLVLLVLLVEVGMDEPYKEDGDIWCSWVKQMMHKWDGKLMIEKEIKSKMTTARYVHRV